MVEFGWAVEHSTVRIYCVESWHVRYLKNCIRIKSTDKQLGTVQYTTGRLPYIDTGTVFRIQSHTIFL